MLAQSGGLHVWGDFPGVTRSQFVEGLATFLIAAGWKLRSRVKAARSGALGGNPSNGNQFEIGGVIYTWRTTINDATPREVKIGASLAASLGNLKKAINREIGAGTDYSGSTIVHPTVSATLSGTTLTLTVRRGGPQGNGTTSTIGTLIGGGFKLLGESPQNQQITVPPAKLSVLAYVFDEWETDAFGNKLACVRLMREANETIATGTRKVRVLTGRRFRVVANRCQFFCYVQGTAADARGSVVCGGVPWVPPQTACAGQITASPSDEAFWLSGDAGLAVQSTPRTVIVRRDHVTQESEFNTGVINDAGGFGSSDAVFNGSTATGGNATGEFRVVSMTPSNTYPDVISAAGGTGALVSRVAWHGNAGMQLEPLIAWGPTSSDPPEIRGQLWDAWIITRQTAAAAADVVKEFDSAKWLAFTDRHKFGTLWLRVPALAPIEIETLRANYAF